MRQQLSRSGFFLLPLLIFTACAHQPIQSDIDSRQLLSYACSIGKRLREVKGSIWLKAESEDMKGQFPADVTVSSKGRLHLVVTDLLGGPQATIHVENGKYRIESQRQGRMDMQGSDQWAGVPLQWSVDLFLGRIPCPAERDLAGASLIQAVSGELEVQTANERFVYGFHQWGGRPWPERLHWESRKSAGVYVDFEFQDPEDGSLSPKRWSAVSARGLVKVRWKDRKIEGIE